MSLPRCAVASAERQEPMFGTASTVSRWLLVEQPGPWGPTSFPESRLDPAVRESLQAQARRLGARPLLVRRHGGAEPPAGTRSVLVVDTAPGRERVLRRTVRDDELTALPLGSGWVRDDAPLYLVCTHGRHDTCCAMRGRPLARALAELDPDRTWECSHIGGDRFASNTLVLPGGLYYGRLGAQDAAELIARTREGRVIPESLRGRSSLSVAAQVAQHFARAQLGAGPARRDRLDDLLPVGEEQVGPAVWRVRLRDGTQGTDEVAVTVRRTREGTPQVLTCHAPAAAVAPEWELVALDALAPVG